MVTGEQIIEWLQPDIPELAVIPILLEDHDAPDLGIEGLERETIESKQYMDFSKLSGVRAFYEKGIITPSKTACVIMLENTRDMVVEVPLKTMVEAWKHHKKWKHGKQ
jgi:hypothetical protein